MALEQKVAEANAKSSSLEDKINEKLESHAENGWLLREIYITNVDSALLLFERNAPE